MKTIILSTAIGFILLGTIMGQSDKAKTQIAGDVQKILDDQTQAWNKCDLAQFMQGYWKSEELSFTSGNKNTRGWQATFENYKRGYDSCEKMGKLSFSELDVTVLSEKSAMVRGRFMLERKNDKPTGLFTLIFRKFKEGWRIVHDHTSS